MEQTIDLVTSGFCRRNDSNNSSLPKIPSDLVKMMGRFVGFHVHFINFSIDGQPSWNSVFTVQVRHPRTTLRQLSEPFLKRQSFKNLEHSCRFWIPFRCIGHFYYKNLPIKLISCSESDWIESASDPNRLVEVYRPCDMWDVWLKLRFGETIFVEYFPFPYQAKLNERWMTFEVGNIIAEKKDQGKHSRRICNPHLHSSDLLVLGIREPHAKQSFQDVELFVATNGTTGEWLRPFRNPRCQARQGCMTWEAYLRTLDWEGLADCIVDDFDAMGQIQWYYENAMEELQNWMCGGDVVDEEMTEATEKKQKKRLLECSDNEEPAKKKIRLDN